jgi:hypothetical protein
MAHTPHTFHIPVMGTGFSIDTPLRVAKYGISSVMSLVDDTLIEQMRKHHCDKQGLPYKAITRDHDDCRAERITAYLNLVDRLVQQQVISLQASPFENGSDITRYFEMLPESSLKQAYRDMQATRGADEKAQQQEALRQQVVPGSIDVNIMTKLDRPSYRKGKELPAEFSEAMAALRGYAQSTLRSFIVFSAGLNQRLYGYAAQFQDFLPDALGDMKKKIILKVSDYRSAMVQAKFLAKRGLWVSEYRVESGLNCGGHAFPTRGLLLGPILEEFRQHKHELIESLQAIYNKALTARERPVNDIPHEVSISVQGGIGTAQENDLLFRHYQVNGTGWGTPFLLVPEAINLDEAHLEKLMAATEEDVYLSDSSPMGMPFWNLRTSASEDARRQRNLQGKPGSACPKRHLASNSEFTEVPLCTASSAYLHLKSKQGPVIEDKLLAKSCICHDLSGGATLKLGIVPSATPAVCCGPNILNFKQTATLAEMAGHIYGRLSLLTEADRPHMFVQELMLYVEYLRKEMQTLSADVSARTEGYCQTFRDNLLSGIDHYRGLAEEIVTDHKKRFLDALSSLQDELESIPDSDVPCGSSV